MKLWLAQRVTGEDHVQLEKEMKKIVSVLEDNGHEPYCSFLDSEMKKKEKVEKVKNAFMKIDESEGTLAIIKSEDKSEGMLIKMGYTVAKGKKLILVIKKGVMEDKYVRAIASQVIEFDDIDDLVDKLGEIK